MIKRTSWKPDTREFNLFSQSALLQLSILGIIAAAAVVFWGLTGPVIAKVLEGKDVATLPDFYNQKGYFAAVFILFIMGVNGFLGYFKKRVLLRISAAAIIISFLFYAVSFPSSHAYVDFIAPLILFSLGSLIFKTVKAWNGSGLKKAFLWKLFSDLAHIGIVIVVAGAVVSGSLSTTYEMVFDYNSDLGRVLEMGEGYSVRLDDIKVFQDSQSNWIQDGYVTVLKGKSIETGRVSRMINDARYGHQHSPFISRGVTDVYGVFYGVGHQSRGVFAFYNFKIMPFVNIIWIGVVLLLIGMMGVVFLDRR